ncbi:MAG: [citrate (pro-3S)-lyase] ligase [Synergistaceae bacterium]|nr:[citrate (pro-3S)-lyase] ligase [Synergistaceae bacterium]
MDLPLFEKEIKNKRQLREMESLLAGLDLSVPEGFEYAIGLYTAEDELVGCGCLKGDILQGLAIAPECQGEGLASKIVSRLIQQAALSGKSLLYVFTKPSMARLIESLGFREIADASPFVVLFEYGTGGVGAYKESLAAYARKPCAGTASSVVMNCNPFTLGHRYLIECALEKSDFLYIFVVEENMSEFSFPDRIRLVREGVADLQNVMVLPGGRYIISNLTFPSYFTKEEDMARAQSALDATLFCTVIAPTLNIGKRFVGSEPFSQVTGIYNETLQKILPSFGINVEEVPRARRGGIPISASAVRRYISEGKIEDACALLPDITKKYVRQLFSPGS